MRHVPRERVSKFGNPTSPEPQFHLRIDEEVEIGRMPTLEGHER
jgi:hypothetical protein